jgi:hypothetical protein
MTVRRWFGWSGLLMTVVLLIVWAHGFIGLMVPHPRAYHFEFCAHDGAIMRVEDGELKFEGGSHSVATPAKRYVDAAAVIVPSVFALIACVLVIRSAREMAH